MTIEGPNFRRPLDPKIAAMIIVGIWPCHLPFSLFYMWQLLSWLSIKYMISHDNRGLYASTRYIILSCQSHYTHMWGKYGIVLYVMQISLSLRVSSEVWTGLSFLICTNKLQRSGLRSMLLWYLMEYMLQSTSFGFFPYITDLHL